MRGKLIVIEGTDCSGKETQSKKLVERLEKEGIPVKVISFPFYNTPTGDIIGGPYLGKKHISDTWFSEGPTNVDPKVGSLFYAADRYYNLPKIKSLLSKGVNVIIDRYSSSNMAHQGGKIQNKNERLAFYEWVDDLEYKLLGLPKPDMTFLLYMPYQYSLMLRERRAEAGDGHEMSKEHLINAEAAYLELAELYDYIVVNDTVENAADKIMAIIRAEHAKTERTIATYQNLIGLDKE